MFKNVSNFGKFQNKLKNLLNKKCLLESDY